jgi:hypothetical protein
MAKETNETGERLVIGIDYGTTYTGTPARLFGQNFMEQ